LYEATEKFAAPDSIARKVLGDEFVEHYAATRRHEWMKWAGTVTDWELRRYLELV
jgi:glutamine synthetase